MVRHKIKKAVAIAMSAVIALTAVPNLPLQYEKKAEAATTEISSADVTSKYNKYFSSSNKKTHVSVHDPSIVIGYTDTKYTGNKSVKIYGEQDENKTRKEVYFVFGSHRAFAWSTDLQNWNKFTNNINDDTKCQALFKKAFEWAKAGDSAYNWTGNLWAPDVFWNADYVNDNNKKGAWCMYMSINGCSWNSSIVLLTSDDLDGDWTNRGTVVYSGFTESGDHAYTSTDFAKVVGEDEAKKLIADTKTYKYSDRYGNTSYVPKDGSTNCSATSWNNRYGAHAIDPCVTYDDAGNLWMSYGSWSGGIWMFKLNSETGLRDKTTKYTYQDNTTDPYMGYKLAGGSSASGEASYIEKIGEKYYLFLSYGGLTATGGYNMRVFSSSDIKGPYKDVAGNDARYGATNTSTTSNKAGGDQYGNSTTGERLMSYYDWHYLDKGRVAQGHNSAVVDDDGKAYVIYHTRFNDGTESHEMRVHQLFTAENGGLVATPFEYSGEKLSDTAYAKSDVTGEYTVIYHKPTVKTRKLGCCQEKKITLKENGTVTGDFTGTWKQSDSKPYVTIKVGGVEYKGVFIKQKIEGTGYESMCFTTVGSNNVTFWGTKGYSDEYKVIKDTKELSLNVSSALYTNLELPISGKEGSTITWESSDPSVISNTGEVQVVSKDTAVKITATISNGSYYSKKTYSTTVKSLSNADTKTGLTADYTFENGLQNKVNTSQTGTAKSLSKGTKPNVEYNSDKGSYVLNQYFGYAATNTTSYTEFTNPLKGKSLTGATVSMWVNRQDTDVWDAMWSFVYNDTTANKERRIFFTPNTYLGYNNGEEGSKLEYIDLNRANSVTNNIASKEWHYVTVSLGSSDFGIYVDGNLVCNKSKYTSYSGAAYTSAAANMLSVISSAANFYLGYGSFWGSAPLYMDNVKIYSRALSAADVGALYSSEKTDMDLSVNAQNVTDQANSDASILYNSYNDAYIAADADEFGWSSVSAADSVTIEEDAEEAHKKYVQFAPGQNNSRSAYTSFGNVTLPDKYVVEFDAKLTAGNQSGSQLALSTAAYSKTNCESSNINDSLLNTSYLWSLDTTNSTSWKISSGSTASTAKTDTVTIAKNTWTHFKTTVDKTHKKVTLEITDASGKTLEKMDIAMGSISDVKGLWYLSGKYQGVAGFDNVRIYKYTNTYTVSFNPNYVGAKDAAVSQEFTLGSSQSLKANTFKREGYTFAGWSKTINGAADYKEGQSVTNLTTERAGVVMLYAVWNKNAVFSTPAPTPTVTPTVTPSQKPASSQTPAPGSSATTKPTNMPSQSPTVKPTEVPTQKPTTNPSAEPTVSPSNEPAATPSVSPSTEPVQTPTVAPSKKPATKKLKRATITVKKGKKKVSSVTVKRKKTVKLSVSVNSKAKLSMAKLSKKYAKIVKVKFKKNKLTIKALKKKGKVSIKITSKKTSKYKAAAKTIKVTVK